MGHVDIYKGGKMIRLQRGEYVFESKAFICDNCDTEQPEFGSEIVASLGISLIQFCENCKGLTAELKRKRVQQIKGKR